jgi:hypothetical protein
MRAIFELVPKQRESLPRRSLRTVLYLHPYVYSPVQEVQQRTSMPHAQGAHKYINEYATCLDCQSTVGEKSMWPNTTSTNQVFINCTLFILLSRSTQTSDAATFYENEATCDICALDGYTDPQALPDPRTRPTPNPLR